MRRWRQRAIFSKIFAKLIVSADHRSDKLHEDRYDGASTNRLVPNIAAVLYGVGITDIRGKMEEKVSEEEVRRDVEREEGYQRRMPCFWPVRA